MEEVRAHARRAAVRRHDDDGLDAPVKRDRGLLCVERHGVAVLEEQRLRDARVARVVAGERNLLRAGLAEDLR